MSSTDTKTDPACNISHYLPRVAAAFPWKRAVVAPVSRDAAGRVTYSQQTFTQLNAASDRVAWALSELGVTRGARVLVMVRPGLDFVALAFALFKIAAVPVFIDPGMGLKAFLRCAAMARPETLVAVPRACLLRRFFPRYFKTVKRVVTTGRRSVLGVQPLPVLPAGGDPFPVTAVEPDETAAILFTTGSTGPAKGVVYTHRIFTTQTELIRREYRITPDDVDLPCFPLFALFSTAMGVTAVIPDMDPSRPASVDPERIVEAIQDHGVTYSFGSPALWRRVSQYCIAHGITLPSLRCILMAGAPVPGELHRQILFNVVAEGARTYTPYGATEALPLTTFTGAEMLAMTEKKTRQGAGICVGRPLREIAMRIIRITEDAIASWGDDLVLPQGEIGEVAVKGPIVTREYDGLPEETRRAKIPDGDGFWHRMGDLGYLDGRGRLWFCGRKAHRVITAEGTLYTIPCEAVFNEHPHVFRSALVGIGADRCRQTPVIVIEPHPEHFPRDPADASRFRDELLELGQTADLLRTIRHVLFHKSFPVDIRHNAKIKRELLAQWAASELT